ncbi:hypothetical protein FNV43_RR09415 [Rhamnella rubrinervis]|uniref:RING-type domain-containing protein n=1 Tax=Rhamnella rubrinervis TaxID=2594499 RepID=A0A8K0MJY9_9ROSA|nr:hypothetical protein FNV43_RR09415 [Rhamnella rubrinervis]
MRLQQQQHRPDSPEFREFVIKKIDHRSLTININDDVDKCFPKRYLFRNFNVSGTPFQPQDHSNVTLLNCSSFVEYPTLRRQKKIDCLSSSNYEVVALPTYKHTAPIALCRVIFKVSVPVSLNYSSNLNVDDVVLKWVEPNCGDCETSGGHCGFMNNDTGNSQIGCFYPENYQPLPPTPNNRYAQTTRSLSDSSSVVVFLLVYFVFVYVIKRPPSPPSSSSPEIARSSSAKTCPETYCPSNALTVKFPFRLPEYQRDPRCGYPGFHLSCNNRNETIVSLPSGDFAVRSILYERQKLWIDDPETYCLPKRLMEKNFSVSGTNFMVENLTPFAFLNCSSDVVETTRDRLMKITCLSTDKFTVVAVPTELFNWPPPSRCRVLSTALFPETEWWLENWGIYMNTYIELTWKEPSCGICELGGGDCGFKSDIGLKTGCHNIQNHGLSRSVEYAILTTSGVLGLLCFMVLRYTSGRRGNREASTSTTTTADSSATRQSVSGTGRAGLEGPIIESYPKTQVGESGRLPKDGQTTCSICLSEYKPKDTLRTIPPCNHDFHAHCIDKWLRVNATCPFCRKEIHAPLSLV